jgi:hypothetical protein
MLAIKTVLVTVAGNRKLFKKPIKLFKNKEFACKTTMPAIKTVLVTLAGNRNLFKKLSNSLKIIELAYNNDAGDQDGVGDSGRKLFKKHPKSSKNKEFVCKTTMPAINTVLVTTANYSKNM